MKDPYKRYTEGSRVFYDVLASKGTFYYTVEMLGAIAISCECTGNAEFKRHCKHMDTAEKAEYEFQKQESEFQKRDSAKIPSTEHAETVKGVLNGNQGFSMLRK